jgi:DUF1009 family protein
MQQARIVETSKAVAPDDTKGPVAIVCGGGSLPFAVADAAIRSGRQVTLVALRGWADPERVRSYPHAWTSVGQFGRACRIAREAGCREVVFIGSLVRPALRQLQFDFGTVRILPRLLAAYRGGDDHLLSGLARIVEAEGFRMVGAHEVAPDILMPEGRLGARSPSPDDRADIAFGLGLLRATSPFDIGQAVVVARNHVLAVEAAEGTDQMLDRIAELRRIGRIKSPNGAGVLVKAPKSGQDRRFDLPSIGPLTVEKIAHAGLAGLAVVAGETVVAEPATIAKIADHEQVFVAGIRDGAE